MRTIRPAWLLAVAAVLATAGWVTTALTSRASVALPVLPLSSLITMGLIVVVCWILGWRVRSWRDGKRTKLLDPLLAARTVILAQACAYAGAVLLGWHIGIVINQLSTFALRSDWGILWHLLALLGGGAAMVVTGVVVERFCRIPPEDGSGVPGPSRGDVQGENGYA